MCRLQGSRIVWSSPAFLHRWQTCRLYNSRQEQAKFRLVRRSLVCDHQRRSLSPSKLSAACQEPLHHTSPAWFLVMSFPHRLTMVLDSGFRLYISWPVVRLAPAVLVGQRSSSWPRSIGLLCFEVFAPMRPCRAQALKFPRRSLRLEVTVRILAPGEGRCLWWAGKRKQTSQHKILVDEASESALSPRIIGKRITREIQGKKNLDRA